MKSSAKQGYDIKSLAGLGVAFVVIAIVLSFGATILSDLKTDTTTRVGVNTTAYNATVNGLESIEELSSWLPTLALIVVAAVIIGIIVTYFAMRA